MSLQEKIYEAMAEMMVSDYRMDVAKVLSWEEKTIYGGYCDTCYYEEMAVEIQYLDSEGELKMWEYPGTFASLVSSF